MTESRQSNSSHVASSTERRPSAVIQAHSGLRLGELRELWNHRYLLRMLAERDLRLRYKQTALGIAWVLLQPLLAAAIFAIIFGRFANIPSDGFPYLLMVFCGLLPWNYFAGVIQRASTSMVQNSHLISKVYFPRLLVPSSSALAVFLDFLISCAVLAILLMIYRVGLTWNILALPLLFLLTAMTATGASFWLSALGVRYRDFVHITPFLLQIWMYASPVIYPTSIVSEQWRVLYSLNPVVGLIEGFRWCVLGESRSLTPEMMLVSVGAALVIFIGGLIFFQRAERTFADVI